MKQEYDVIVIYYGYDFDHDCDKLQSEGTCDGQH